MVAVASISRALHRPAPVGEALALKLRGRRRRLSVVWMSCRSQLHAAQRRKGTRMNRRNERKVNEQAAIGFERKYMPHSTANGVFDQCAAAFVNEPKWIASTCSIDFQLPPLFPFSFPRSARFTLFAAISPNGKFHLRQQRMSTRSLQAQFCSLSEHNARTYSILLFH